MIDKIKLIFTTDSLPVAGGGIGAFTQALNVAALLPTLEAVISTIVITAIGSIVGYLIKLILDKIFKRNVQKF